MLNETLKKIIADSDAEFLTEARETAASVAAAVSGDSLILPAFTDMHIYDLTSDCLAKLEQGLALVGEELAKKGLAYDAVISLGDNPAMLGRERHSSNAEISSLLTGIYERLSETTDATFYIINGNHDGIGTDFFDTELWYDSVAKRFGGDKLRREGHSAYFYTDIEKTSTRMIFASVPHGSDLTAEYPTPLWSFGDEQLSWLADKALAVPDGWNVLVFCHVPPCDAYSGDMTTTLGVWTGEREAKSYISTLCGWIDDRDAFEGILRAYAERSRFDSPKHNVSADYSGLKNTRLSACVSGHIHSDLIYRQDEKLNGGVNSLPCTQIVIGSANPAINSRLAKSMRFGVSFDVMVYSPSRGKLELIRFGDGVDREIRF